MFCSYCGTQLAADARFCAKCGKAVVADSAETIVEEDRLLDANQETLAADVPTPAVQQRTPIHAAITPRFVRSGPPSIPPLTSDPIGGGRFAPGLIIGDRYRIVAILGRGGMGEVYRAEDLKLSQVVAIKFLPETLSKDVAALARFHAEVRVARQVSHPNVCRVFDIGDAEGIPFLTMEYVDGEDLASLIRRIGRLPQDKAVEVSRQICAGLAAAHERGVIHRDLKPANLMLDGTGKIRITDFGLAGIAATIQGAEIRAGTPAYMAPEQMAGKEVTARSDIYSLGLVMYEILTGKRAFEAPTLPELLKQRDEGRITNPSAFVRDLDPLIERIILRCLENDPAKRPTSVLQVAAALPGGDPLAAALAAGETPSPEMVAAAGAKEGLNPRIGLLCVAGICVLLALLVGISKRSKLISYISFGPTPEVLAAKASDMARAFGYTDVPADTARGFALNQSYLRYFSDQQKAPHRWELLRKDEPPALMFWYRENPTLLTPITPGDNLIFGRAQPADPPFEQSGGRVLHLSAQGALLQFKAVPPQVDTTPATPFVAPNWSALFAAAHLDPAAFHAVEPRWFPLAYADTRAAWEGTWPSRPDIPLRIEAAGYKGKPIYFQLISPWDKPSRMDSDNVFQQNPIGQWFGLILIFVIFGLGTYISVRNLRSGRGDLPGSARLGLFVSVVTMVNWVLLAHHVASPIEIVIFILAVSVSLFFGGLTAVLYSAVEPYVRRHWPNALISWTRMLSGQFKDAVFARDVLLGTLFGLASAFFEQLQPFVENALGKAPMRPMGLGTTYALEGLRGTLASIFYQAASSFSSALLIFFLFFICRLVFRRNWLAAITLSLIFCIPSFGAQNPMIDALFTAPFFLIYLFILARFGLVVLTVLYFVDQLADQMPIAMPLNAWYIEGGLVSILVILAVALYGFHYSRGGKPLLGDDALEI